MIKLGDHVNWTKSSYSTGNGACVEVRSTRPTAVALTDSKIKDTPARPSFSVSPQAFAALVGFARTI